jgi:hypothetical protein
MNVTSTPSKAFLFRMFFIIAVCAGWLSLGGFRSSCWQRFPSSLYLLNHEAQPHLLLPPVWPTAFKAREALLVRVDRLVLLVREAYGATAG